MEDCRGWVCLNAAKEPGLALDVGPGGSATGVSLEPRFLGRLWRATDPILLYPAYDPNRAIERP